MMAFPPTTTSCMLDIHPSALLPRNPALFSKERLAEYSRNMEEGFTKPSIGITRFVKKQEVDRCKYSASFVRDCHSLLPLQTPMQWHLSSGRYHLGKSYQCYGVGDDGLSSVSITQDIDDFIRKAVNMSVFERINWAWNILFPRKLKRTSNAEIAKQRLKMILFSDRCAVTDDAKRKIVNNIVGALSDFVEIDSEDKVQLNVSTDADLGTVYSVTVPVRRVKPEYQEYSEGFGDIRNLEYKDVSGQVSAFDIKLDYLSPNDGKA